MRAAVARRPFTIAPSSLTERRSLTLVPHVSHQPVEFFENRHGALHVGKKAGEIITFKFSALRVAPVVACLVPFAGEFAGGGQDDFAVGADVHLGSSSWGAGKGSATVRSEERRVGKGGGAGRW